MDKLVIKGGSNDMKESSMLIKKRESGTGRKRRDEKKTDKAVARRDRKKKFVGAEAPPGEGHLEAEETQLEKGEV
jgi:hypothetical protein